MESPSVLTFQTVHLNYIRNSRAIAVLWCVFTVCFAIINIVVFRYPWLNSGEDTEKEGYFSLYEACKFETTNIPGMQATTTLNCNGSWTYLQSAVNPVATFFIGFSCLINLLCIATFLVLFLFVNPAIIFTICGVLQLISTICMVMGCTLYPNNWDSVRIVEICETSSSYYAGKCRITWAYILAIVGIFDILFLSILAFVLARRQAANYQQESSQVNFIQDNYSNKNFYPTNAMDNNAYETRSDIKTRSRRNSMQDFEL